MHRWVCVYNYFTYDNKYRHVSGSKTVYSSGAPFDPPLNILPRETRKHEKTKAKTWKREIKIFRVFLFLKIKSQFNSIYGTLNLFLFCSLKKCLRVNNTYITNCPFSVDIFLDVHCIFFHVHLHLQLLCIYFYKIKFILNKAILYLTTSRVYKVFSPTLYYNHQIYDTWYCLHRLNLIIHRMISP